MIKKRPANRPRKNPGAIRVTVSYRLDPATVEKIEAEAKQTGTTKGEVVERAVARINGDVNLDGLARDEAAAFEVALKRARGY